MERRCDSAKALRDRLRSISRLAGLLPQPSGLESFIPGLEEVNLTDLPVSEVGAQPPDRLANRHSGPLDAPSQLSKYENAIAEVANLIDDRCPIVEAVIPGVHEFANAAMTDSRLRAVGPLGERIPSDVLRTKRKERVETSRIPRRDDPACDLHVLLRHRLLPQPGGFEGFGRDNH